MSKLVPGTMAEYEEYLCERLNEIIGEEFFYSKTYKGERKFHQIFEITYDLHPSIDINFSHRLLQYSTSVHVKIMEDILKSNSFEKLLLFLINCKNNISYEDDIKNLNICIDFMEQRKLRMFLEL